MKIKTEYFRRHYIFIVSVLLSIVVSSINSVLAIQYPEIRFYDKWLFIFAVLLIFFDYLINPHKIKTLPNIKYILPLVCYMLFHEAFFLSNISTYYHGPYVIQLFLMSLLFVILPKNRNEHIIIIKILWFCLFVLFSYYLYYLLTVDTVIGFDLKRIHIEEYGASININTLSFLSVVWAVLSLYLKEMLTQNETNKFSILVVINFLLAITICTFHSSRAALIIGILCFAYYLYALNKNKIVFCFSVLILTFLSNYFYTIIDWSSLHIAERMQFQDEGFRIKQIQLAIEDFMQNPIFGSNGDVLIDRSGVTQHTFYINFITLYGILGLLLFIPLFKKMISTGLKRSTPSQNMAKFFFIGVLLTAPPMYGQIIALIIIASPKYFLIDH
tara:strand:+ start:3089 stop:4246 length:1158 start_codon:yes stop_codon:yes gene_type:complete